MTVIMTRSGPVDASELPKVASRHGGDCGHEPPLERCGICQRKRGTFDRRERIHGPHRAPGTPPCGHESPIPDRCRLCKLAMTDGRYQAAWGLPVTAPTGEGQEDGQGGPDYSRLRLPCIHRGKDPIGKETPGCGACSYYACARHGECVGVGTDATKGKLSAKGRRACLTCQDYERPEAVKPTAGEEIAMPGESRGLRWAYGVTTVERRRRDLLPRTLASLRKAGFDRPHLFVDGGKDSAGWEGEFGLPVTLRGGDPVRTAGAWVLSIYELYCREPSADRFALFQDDLVTYANLRRYLSTVPYPAMGYCNLYTFPSNEQLVPLVGMTKRRTVGWFRSAQNGRGAVGLVFSREAVVELLSSRHLAERPQDAHRGHRSIDGGILESMRKAGWKEYCHWPSLVQHEGEVSSMGNAPHKRSECFRGEGFDAMGLVEEMAHN